jgi:hypothetical protein
MGARRADGASVATGYRLMGVRSFVVEAPLCRGRRHAEEEGVGGRSEQAEVE